MTTKPNSSRGGRPRAADRLLSLILRDGATRREVATIAGVTGATLDGWCRRGCPRRPDGRFDLPAVVAWLREDGDALVAARLAKADGDAEKALALWRGYRAERERLALARETGDLIERAEVVDYAGRAVLTVRNRLNDLVRKMAARLFNAPSREWIEEQMQDEVDAICSTYERGMGTDAEPPDPADTTTADDAASAPAGTSNGGTTGEAPPVAVDTDPPADPGTTTTPDRRNEQ